MGASLLAIVVGQGIEEEFESASARWCDAAVLLAAARGACSGDGSSEALSCSLAIAPSPRAASVFPLLGLPEKTISIDPEGDRWTRVVPPPPLKDSGAEAPALSPLWRAVPAPAALGAVRL